MPRKFLGVILLLFLNSCGIFKSNIPQPKTEFRGVWIATVVNIDWPKNGLDSVEKQKKDYLKILDFYHDLKYNAVIVQVRAAGDAFYKSEHAPWSRFLTGKEGENNKWNEDPLEWMIQEAHQRGMEFHAWLNPYRATFDLNTEILSDNHDFNVHPDWMVQYGSKYYYNPGLPEVQNKITSIVEELTDKYNIDGVHFDDYFYPYTIQGEVFNDSITFYNCAKPRQSLADWRRSNVDSLINKSHTAIKKAKPTVQFGVSPFGVWKNNATDPRGSYTKAGQTTFENLYADPLIWMENGWLDYLAPQIYWSMDFPVASHKILVDWWAKNSSSSNTNIYIGNGAYKVRNNSDSAWDNKKELPNQFRLARLTPEISGNIVFSARSLMENNSDVVSYLKRKYYKWPALTPTSPIVDAPLEKINIIGKVQTKNAIQLTLNKHDRFQFALIYKSGKKLSPELKLKHLQDKIFIAPDSTTILIPEKIVKRNYFAITFLDHFGRESEPTIINLKKISGYGTKR
ncbi:family 10 glycosylhydrolase [Maribacter sp. PR1]|uniref:Family 10 glycosylhydrolase n=1 Tax=Maribacter cobaltidurans TaxID=1178778 RepID=A0ABU7IX93_9FLAO|nr:MULTISPECIES: family 10 glycosylhydrolase [Maribacter]MDC6389818.1 family 10 glycosylhydrolase [Maribacter sp. PR1]MEE1977208.1 family 10 glycosylhydrolase [Maribacter cobaltidurans]